MPSILVTEDLADIRDLLVMHLRSAGYQVTAVVDGVAALSSHNEPASDLMTVDLIRPGTDGLELCMSPRTRP